MSKFGGLALPVEKPARLYLLHPVKRVPLVDQSGEKAYIDVWSNDSPRRRQLDRSMLNERLDRRNRGNLMAEDIEAKVIDAVAHIVAGWHLVSLDGQTIDVPFSEENARELIADGSMLWLREQIEEFAADRANFFRASSTA